MERVHEIYITDGGAPIRASRCSEDGVGVRYTDDEGRQVRVPWGRVDRVVTSRLVEDPADLEPDDALAGDVIVPPAAEPEGDDTPDTNGEPDGKASKASEWADADPDVVRAWARKHGEDVKDSGPIPKAVLSKYAAAHS